MAVITPNTDVILLKVPLEISDNNQLTFANATAQYNYFYGLPKLAFDKFTYQRKDNTIRVGALIDDLYEYNYVMYRNTNHSSKWYYAYITDLQYVSDQVTAISIKTDVWQTYQFDLTYKKVFVEREHVNDDTFGLHTVPENIETGEYMKNSDSTTYTSSNDTYWYCIGVSEIIGTLTPAPSSKINNLPNGLFYIFADSVSDIHLIVEMYDKAGKSASLYTLFIFPKQLLYRKEGQQDIWEYNNATWDYTAPDGDRYSLLQIYTPKSSDHVGQLNTAITVTPPTKIGKTYTPKNNKMFCYPFNYFNVSNNNGTTVTYHYEDFNGNPSFNIDGVLCTGCSTKLYPTNYKGFGTSDNTYDYGITGGKYPTLSWVSDSYTNWITQNSVNMNANVGIRAASAGMGALSFGGGAAAIAATTSALFTIGQNLRDAAQASRMPDQANGNLNVGDLTYSKLKTGFTFLQLSVKPEYAKICDDYMSMFGYKVNEVKIPNVTGRTNWNYVKTIGCYIKADIPQDDLDEIKSLFDKGITFWHNPSTFMDYSQSNAIVS